VTDCLICAWYAQLSDADTAFFMKKLQNAEDHNRLYLYRAAVASGLDASVDDFKRHVLVVFHHGE
jgi:hypothetical protein